MIPFSCRRKPLGEGIIRNESRERAARQPLFELRWSPGCSSIIRVASWGE